MSLVKLNDYVVGTCLTMCPHEEIKMRERESLLHILEVIPGTERHSKPRADVNRMVKKYNRSAAGKSMTSPKNLRPPDILLKTVHYLLEEIVHVENVSWITKYNFITDRLRSVRQDMIIQNISRSYLLVLLQPMVRFYAYCGYRFCDEELITFDPYLNRKYLEECFYRLLVVYDEFDELIQTSSLDIDCINFIKESRSFFEALHVILSLGNESVLQRAIGIPKMWRQNDLEIAIKVAKNVLKNNFLRVCRYIQELPLLHSVVAALYLSDLRRSAFRIISVAYKSNNLVFPLETLRHWLLYDNDENLSSDCIHYGVTCETDYIKFNKNIPNMVKTVSSRKEEFVERLLDQVDESDIFLYNEF